MYTLFFEPFYIIFTTKYRTSIEDYHRLIVKKETPWISLLFDVRKMRIQHPEMNLHPMV